MFDAVLTWKLVTVNIASCTLTPAFSWLPQYSQHVHCSQYRRATYQCRPRQPNTADTTVNQLHSPLVLTAHLSDSHHNVILSSPWSLKWPFPNRFSHENSLHSHLLPSPTSIDSSRMSLSDFNQVACIAVFISLLVKFHPRTGHEDPEEE